MALTLACRHQAIGETRVVHRTFYTCLEWQVQESTAQLNVVKAWIKSHWLWSVLACACSESQVTLVRREIYALWLLFSWRPEIAAAWKHCSRTGDKFCDSIFRYLSDSFETSLTHQVSELTQRQLMGLISLAHGRAGSRRRVGKANGWNRSGFPPFARSM